MILLITVKGASQVNLNFTIPDTVCVNTAVNINNTSTGFTNYFWNFCVADVINTFPTAQNLGNIDGTFTTPVFTDIVSENGNYYVFVVNNYPSSLVRLDYGSSLLNTPTAVSLGTVGGVVPLNAEGIQVVKNEGSWYAIIVGGTPVVNSKIVKIDFGASIANPTPTGTSWGNIGDLAYPTDLHVFSENGVWYGFTLNFLTGTITRFNFTTSFKNVPTAVNLGNIGNLQNPTGIFAINDNNKWHVFVINEKSSSLSRLDFGASLLNTPTGVNLGNPDNNLHGPRDLYLVKFCGQIVGLAVNGGTDDLVRFDFKNNLLGSPDCLSLGNIGNFSFPHSISKIFREGADLYTFVTNASNNTITRVKFTGCSNSSVPGSALKNPPSVTYNTPGTYNINLLADEGLPTQTSLCKQVTVLQPAGSPVENVVKCKSDTLVLKSTAISPSFMWNTGSSSSSIKIIDPGTYWVQYNKFGCSVRDSFLVTNRNEPGIAVRSDTSICAGDSVQLTVAANDIYTYNWTPSLGLSNANIASPYAKPGTSTAYVVSAKNNFGCIARDTIRLSTLTKPEINLNHRNNICKGDSVQLSPDIKNANSFQWLPAAGLSNSNSLAPFVMPQTPTTYTITAKNNSGCQSKDSVFVNVFLLPSIQLNNDTSICKGDAVKLTANAADAIKYLWEPSAVFSNPGSSSQTVSPVADTRYVVSVTNSNNCSSKDTVNFTVIASPVFSLAKDTSICSGDSIRLHANGQGVAKYHWEENMALSDVDTSSPVVKPVITSKYFVTAFNTAGCDAKDSVLIKVTTPLYTLSNDTSICQGDTIQLMIKGNELAKYSWSASSTLSNLQIPNPMAFPASATKYYVTITDIHNCSIEDSTIITTTPKPFVNTIENSALCQGDSIQLKSTVSATTFDLQWIPATALTSSTALSPIARPSITTTFTIIANSNGCKATDSVTITVNPIPNIQKSADILICSTDSVQLSAGSGYQYQWTPTAGLSASNISDPFTSTDTTVLYHVRATDSQNCNAYDSILVQVKSLPDFKITPLAATVCKGNTIRLTASGGDVYKWTPDENASGNTNNLLVSPVSATFYQVIMGDTLCNIYDTLYSNITIAAAPDVTVSKSNNLDCTTDRTTLTATGGIKYRWYPSNSLSDSLASNPVARPVQSTTYYVEVTNNEGCSKKDSISIVVDNVNNKNGYWVSSAFTPNHDGLNECFGVKNWGIIKKFNMSIYNRWGEEVFHSNAIDNCWNGDFKGQNQPSGTFIYQIRASTQCGDVYKKGTVVLIR